jgi:crotonobetainyl-CoA:carnitine CoA-transferase CaiB-like acyl-CoA transferase
MVLMDPQGQRHLGPPIRFKEDPPQPHLFTPAYGEHSGELAREAGLSADAIVALKARGAI